METPNQDKHCQNCKYYIQHYTKYGKGYMETYCGYCRYPRLKTQKPDTKACQHFWEAQG